MKLKLLILFVALSLNSTGTFAQSRREKKEAKIAESEKPKNVAGGIRIGISKSYTATYDAVLNWVKRADYTIESGDKENGLITTAITVTGGYSQTGTRLMLTLIKESETATTLKVVVTEQKRKKLLSTEPWSDAKLNEKETQKVADQLKAAL